MRCTHCGQKLEAGDTTCTQCGTDLTPHTRTMRLMRTILFFALSTALAALLIYVVLQWHNAQIFS